ncbi:MAG: protein-disulfide reductase DsbD family protein [Gloeomargarita sp. SKYBB_i_bin120]|nr:protein-disulfide reductase DsbD family protein [Gloeomargarita sp. SKYG98]MCS7293417.1 protein-disulfide reductase DsbD family protein [Gloeomargarita sp. SKYB120]MDW8178983.1 protein-disulfide reductase DsbD family protein [Gloeomargarita sp. SKYBB_i_bin120]
MGRQGWNWLAWTALLLWSWLALTLPAWAKPPRYVQARLLSDVQVVQPGRPFWVGLQLDVTPGWYVYWQNPGDSGDRVRVDWQLPPGVTVGEWLWPYPQRIPAGPLVNFGYRNTVTLLAQVRPPATLPTGRTLDLRAEASWLVCKTDCVPEATTLSLSLPVGPQAVTNPEVMTHFAQVRQTHPQPAPWPVGYTLTSETLTLSWPEGRVQQAVFFPLTDGVITNAAPQTLHASARQSELVLQRGYLDTVSTVDGVLVVTTSRGTRAYQIQATPMARPESRAVHWWHLVGLAFWGGLLLNVMPCVLPILSLKTLHLVEKVRQSPSQVRASGLVYGAGVLVSFWLLAGGLLVLRALGEQLGWGFQLQSPAMVLVLMYVLFGVALNLSGVFTVGSRWVGVGQSLTEKPGYVGEFFSGLLAAVAATPCTAPFMATAIGTALTLPPVAALSVFTGLGAGFALPYVLLCFVPAWRRWLPRPGNWMHTLQQLLAFPLYAAAAWLLWVLTLQTGTDGLAVGLTGLLLLGLAAWFYGRGQSQTRWHRWGRFGALVLVAFCLTLPGWLPSATPVATPTQTVAPSEPLWEPFTPARLEELRRQGQPVFVNCTAAWCVSCQVNERLVFGQPEVQQAFRQRGVRMLKADWTRRNPEITQLLQQFGRSGVPLYVLYPGKNQAPVVWPSRLNAAQVKALLSSQIGG